MPARLVSYSFKFRMEKQEQSAPDKKILPKLENQLREKLEDKSTTSSKSTISSVGSQSQHADMAVEVICTLAYRVEGKTMLKRVAAEATLSDKMVDILTGLVSQSETLKSRDHQRGRLFYPLDEEKLDKWKELPFSAVGQHNLYQLIPQIAPGTKYKDIILLVFDSCGWMEKSPKRGAEWTVPIDKDYIN